MARNDLVTGNVWEQYSKKVQERMNNPKALGCKTYCSRFWSGELRRCGASLLAC